MLKNLITSNRKRGKYATEFCDSTSWNLKALGCLPLYQEKVRLQRSSSFVQCCNQRKR